MPIDTVHAEYSANLARWQTARDCAGGAAAVKDRRGPDGAGTLYLPMPDAGDDPHERASRYAAYKLRANFVNFTAATLEGMVGMVFRKPAALEAGPQIEYLEADANGGGLSLDQMTRDAISDTLLTGRYGLLVDYPEAEPGLTEAEIKARNLRANILPYCAEAVTHWRTETAGGITRLSMVKLREIVTDYSADEFKGEDTVRYRVLRLVNGLYEQQLYADDGKPIGAVVTPRRADDTRWDHIPFICAGALNNDPTTDMAPLYDIAEVNLAHYRNSADYEDSCFIAGQPTPVFMGLTSTWVKDHMPTGVVLGSRSGIALPENADAKLLQAEPNQMPLEGMKHKEQQMIMIGARLIQDTTGVETAEAAKIRFAGQNSKLGAVVGNIEAAFAQALRWAAEFMGGDPETVVYALNREFYEARLDPQDVIAGVQLIDRGVTSVKDERAYLRRAGRIAVDRPDKDIDADIMLDGAGPM